MGVPEFDDEIVLVDADAFMIPTKLEVNDMTAWSRYPFIDSIPQAITKCAHMFGHVWRVWVDGWIGGRVEYT